MRDTIDISLQNTYIREHYREAKENHFHSKKFGQNDFS